MKRSAAATWLLPGRGLQGLGVGLLVMGLLLPWGAVWARRWWAARHAPIEDRGPMRPEMVALPTGMFQMGSRDADADAQPVHTVALATRFALSVTEVTEEQYERVMGENPSDHRGAPDLPVEGVSWLEAVEYCNRLSELEGLETCYVIAREEVSWPRKQACTGYRLPTEAEWEYGARAGSATRYAGSDDLDRVAWHDGNSKGETHAVATKTSNSWGLHDMSGNVWEWVWDWYGPYAGDRPREQGPAHDVKEQRDPTGPETGSARVDRGGSFGIEARDLRVAIRAGLPPSIRFGNLGFRLSRSLPSSL